MQDQTPKVPNHTAVRVALWRALHVEIDAKPHVFEDEVGLKLAAPDENWRARGDMHPEGTKTFRASIVARARFIEDWVAEQASRGVRQYVILGAGLDTFAQRKPETASQMRVFEIDQPETQEWKKKRLVELGYGIPEWLRFVPVDFEKNASWWTQLARAGFDATQPAVLASTGVAMYLTREAVEEKLRQIAKFAPGSTLAMSYLLPMELADPEEVPGRQMAEKGAAAAGTPFLSFFAPEEMKALALQAGFKNAQTIAAADLAQRYFAGRSDGIKTSKSEEILIATT